MVCLHLETHPKHCKEKEMDNFICVTSGLKQIEGVTAMGYHMGMLSLQVGLQVQGTGAVSSLQILRLSP